MISAGRISGRMIRKKIPKWLQPSISAASSSSFGNAPDELHDHEDEEGHPEEPRQEKRVEGVHQVQLREEDVLRDDDDLDRQHQRQQHAGEPEPAAGEPDAREPVGHDRGRHHRGHRSHPRVDQRVPVEGREGHPAEACPAADVVLGREALGDERHHVGPDLRRSLERAGEEPQDRVEHHEAEGPDGRVVDDGPEQLAPPPRRGGRRRTLRPRRGAHRPSFAS